MTDQKEQIIGYGIREQFAKFSEQWSQERINQYLLRHDIEKPLSTDVMVWEDVFHSQDIPLPAWTGPRQGTWVNLERLRNFITTSQITVPYWLIAITEHLPADVQLGYTITPSEISNDWRFLGYDVADPYLLTGLMNCGYWPDEQKTLGEAWRNKLNRYHLFTDKSEADAFRALSDNRVKEHAPFSAYGLYLVEAKSID